MDKRKLLEIKSDLILLLDGIDPQSKIKFENDSILASKYNKNLLKEVCELIDQMIKMHASPKQIDNRYKETFHISKDNISKISLSKIPIPVSTFTYILNSFIDARYVKKLKATQITYWLYRQGYLSEIEHEDGKRFKVLTDKSHLIGLSSKEMINSFGRKYPVILYSENAQKYIIENLDQIVAYK